MHSKAAAAAAGEDGEGKIEGFEVGPAEGVEAMGGAGGATSKAHRDLMCMWCGGRWCSAAWTRGRRADLCGTSPCCCRLTSMQGVGVLFPPGLFDNGRVGRGGMAAGWEAVGGKMAVLARMLHVLYTETTDRCGWLVFVCVRVCVCARARVTLCAQAGVLQYDKDDFAGACKQQ